MAESSKTHHFIPVIIFPSKVVNNVNEKERWDERSTG